jgi:hypothetical protein
MFSLTHDSIVGLIKAFSSSPCMRNHDGVLVLQFLTF